VSTDAVAQHVCLLPFHANASLRMQAVVGAQAECVSQGNAFGCAGASAVANAWAGATAEAHAQAVAQALQGECHCPADSSAYAFGSASTFLQLVADATARVEVSACSRGDASSKAESYADCLAMAYSTVFAQASAEAIVGGDCLDSATSAKILASVGADFTNIQGCARSDISTGSASGTSSGSTDAVRTLSPPIPIIRRVYSSPAQAGHLPVPRAKTLAAVHEIKR
jgi:hypothetical protein